MGYRYHGDAAFEMPPARNAVLVNQTINRIDRLGSTLKSHGVDLCVALFPYEMPVSADAAARYQQDGVRGKRDSRGTLWPSTLPGVS